jgi:hypothetical protein
MSPVPHVCRVALWLQVTTFFQLLVLSFLLPSVALAYDAYRAEEQVFK